MIQQEIGVTQFTKGKTHLMVYMIEQRLTGTFKMPNDLGAYLALSLPFVMGYFVAGFRFRLQNATFARKTDNDKPQIEIRHYRHNFDTGFSLGSDGYESRLDVDACRVGECCRCNHRHRFLSRR